GSPAARLSASTTVARYSPSIRSFTSRLGAPNWRHPPSTAKGERAWMQPIHAPDGSRSRSWSVHFPHSSRASLATTVNAPPRVIHNSSTEFHISVENVNRPPSGPVEPVPTGACDDPVGYRHSTTPSCPLQDR